MGLAKQPEGDVMLCHHADMKQASAHNLSWLQMLLRKSPATV